MKLTFKNINPKNLLNEIVKQGLYDSDIKIFNDLKYDENGKQLNYIAENTWVECNNNKEELINNLVVNLDNTEMIQSTTEELLLQQIADLKLEIQQLKEGK